MSALADRLWFELPAWLGRRSAMANMIAGDGRYLSAWPPVAILAPLVALIVGGYLGLTHEHETYTFSISTMAVLIAVAALGAQLGFWAWLGFAAGDLLNQFVVSPATLFSGCEFGQGFLTDCDRISTMLAPLLVSYLLLGIVMILGPAMASAVRIGADRVLEQRVNLEELPRAVVGHLLMAVVFGAVVYAWALSTSLLIRPIWSFPAVQDPPLEAIEPLQTKQSTLALVAVAAMVLRGVLTVAGRSLRSADPPLTAPDHPIPWWVRLPFKVILLTAMFSGLYATRQDAYIVAGILAAIFVVQGAVLPNLTAYVDVVRRVPVVVRLAVVVAFGYLLGDALAKSALEAQDESFRPAVITILASLALAAVLVPPAAASRREEAAQ